MSQPLKRFIDVIVTCPDLACAEMLANACLSDRLAACATLTKETSSIYRWRGKVENAQEVVLSLKTRFSLFGRLSERVKALHPYEVPCIIALELVAIEPAYAAWLEDETD